MKKNFAKKISLSLALVMLLNLGTSINIANAEINKEVSDLYRNDIQSLYSGKSLKLSENIMSVYYMIKGKGAPVHLYSQENITKIENAINKAYSVLKDSSSLEKDIDEQIKILDNIKNNPPIRKNKQELDEVILKIYKFNDINSQLKEKIDSIYYGILININATDKEVEQAIKDAKIIVDTLSKNTKSTVNNESQDSSSQALSLADFMDIDTAKTTVNKFSDSKEITWSKDSITKVVKKGIMKGSNGKFLPKDTVTRAEVAKVIANILGGDEYDIDMNLSDVDDNKWYTDSVKTVIVRSIFNLEKNNTFRPESNITRAELFIAIAKLKNLSPLSNDEADDILSAYTDKNDISSNDLGYIAALVKEKIVSGSNNKLNPKSVITREQMATIFANIIE